MIFFLFLSFLLVFTSSRYLLAAGKRLMLPSLCWQALDVTSSALDGSAHKRFTSFSQCCETPDVSSALKEVCFVKCWHVIDVVFSVSDGVDC